MPGKSLDAKFLKRTANASYFLGISGLAGIIVTVVSVAFVLISALSAMRNLSTPSTNLTGLLSSTAFVVFLIALEAVLIPITLFFSYAMYRIGNYYGLASLKLAAAVYAASIVLSPVEYLFVLPASSSFTVPASSYNLVPYFLLVFLFIIVVGLVEYVSLIVGFSGIFERTRIADFNTAKVMWIIGIVLIFTLMIALIFYGRGLKKLASQEQAEISIQKVPEGELRYCPHCGAKVKPVDLFCGSCGFNLKKDKEAQ